MSKTYYVDVVCTGHQIFKVVADTKEEAIEAATRQYQRDYGEGEFNELLDSSYDDLATEIEL